MERAWLSSLPSSVSPRLSCHTMALWIGIPVVLSQITVVSLWFVSPTPVSLEGTQSALFRVSFMHSLTVSSMVKGFISISPWGPYIIPTSLKERYFIFPSESHNAHLHWVVPSSTVRMYLSVNLKKSRTDI